VVSCYGLYFGVITMDSAGWLMIVVVAMYLGTVIFLFWMASRD
jgi:hypothetical protein